MGKRDDDRNLLLSKIWAPANEMWGREVADYFIHAHALAEHGATSLTALSNEQLAEIAEWMVDVEHAIGGTRRSRD